MEYKEKIPKHKIKYKGPAGEPCNACGDYRTEWHHMIFGMNRRIYSDYYDLVVPLCSNCHKDLHGANKKGLKEKYQKDAQWMFEKRYGRENYMKIFITNYLKD